MFQYKERKTMINSVSGYRNQIAQRKPAVGFGSFNIKTLEELTESAAKENKGIGLSPSYSRDLYGVEQRITLIVTRVVGILKNPANQSNIKALEVEGFLPRDKYIPNKPGQHFLPVQGDVCDLYSVVRNVGLNMLPLTITEQEGHRRRGGKR